MGMFLLKKFLKKEYISTLILVLLCLPAMCRETKVQGFFDKEIIKLGEPVHYSLTVEYPRNEQVLFPDSSFAFYPFALWNKTWSSTVSNDSISKDSVVYELALFELKSVVSFSLPVYKIVGDDSITIESNVDTVRLAEVVTSINSETKMKRNDTFFEIAPEFNYPYFLIGFLGVCLLIFMLLRYFRKFFVLIFRRLLLRFNHERFIVAFREKCNIIQRKEMSSTYLEDTLIEWKTYIGGLYDLPLSTYTSKDIFTLIPDDKLLEMLRQIDKVIYGGGQDMKLAENFFYLKEKAQVIFNQKTKGLGNAKRN